MNPGMIDMINQVVTEYWVYGEYGEGFGTPRNAFFTSDETDDIRRLRQAGRSENLKWGRSDLKLGTQHIGSRYRLHASGS